jgi:hypothetical protein
MRPVVVLYVLSGLCLAQPAPENAAEPPPKHARVSGVVLNDATGSPLSRVRVFLKSISNEAPSIAVEADDHGRFVIPEASPGKFSISAQRDGYLPANEARQGSSRLPAVIQLDSGQHLRDVTFRLKPWSVIAGRVRFSDAEPAIGVLVQAYKDAFLRGKRSFGMVAATRTNDRGEYRIAGLKPGSYYIAASYDRPLSPEYEKQDPVDENGKRLPRFGYSTTFYPTAQRLADATSVSVASAQEIDGLEVFLQPVRTVNIRGAIVSGLTGMTLKAPVVSLRRLSADERSSINAPIEVKPAGAGFEIRGVAAGPYLLVADTMENNRRLFARVPLLVTDEDIDDLRVLLEPEREWKGSIRIAGAPNLNASLFRVTLEPRSDLNPTASADVGPRGDFSITVVPGEIYDVFVANLPDDFYIESIRLAGHDIGRDGVSGSQAAPAVPLEITVSSRGGVVAGRVFDAAGKLSSGATVMMVPDPADGRPQFFKTGYADRYGLFHVRGLAPGDYTAFAYYDEPPCEFYDPAALSACRSKGTRVNVNEAAQTLLGVRLIESR